jgi:hypothetical protein
MKKLVKELAKDMVISFVIISLFVICLYGCTKNQRAKAFGGSFSIDLPADQKFVMTSWKDNQLWTLTRPKHVDEKIAETYTYQEHSSFGLLQGTVTIKEHFNN